MEDYVRVELHCHSNLSDGLLPPQQVAHKLALAGIQYAALADHDTLEGQIPFKQTLDRLGIAGITGIELTTFLNQQEIHILGYGISLDHQPFLAALTDIRPTHNAIGPNFVPQQRLSTAAGIALLHQAGGIAVFAHPAVTEPDLEKCAQVIDTLVQAGLDGIEAFRGDESEAQQDFLIDQVRRHKLVLAAGTDAHFKKGGVSPSIGIDMPTSAWKAFRDAVLTASSQYRGMAGRVDQPIPARRGPARIHWRSFALNIILPAVLALSLFAGVLLFAVLPAFEHALIERKREMIRELTNTAWSVLAEAAQEEGQGSVTAIQARSQAIKRIEAMRYGPEAKDYFWIQDTTPRMIMHPYRKDLDGSDLSGFTDPRGAPIFVLFSRLVKDKNEGYVNYVWQWKDDPTRLEPKESYIRLFAPWGWIIGTGLYVHDVHQEVRRLEQRLALLSVAICALVALLLIYIMRSSLRIERKRILAEELLRETTLRYKTLVDAATEGMLYISGNRCRYGNPTALELLGYTAHDLELLDLADILPEIAENAHIHRMIETAVEQRYEDSPVCGQVRRRNGTFLDCTLTIQSTGFADSNNFLLLIRRSAAPVTGAGFAQTFSGPLGRLLQLPTAMVQDISEEIALASTRDAVVSACMRAPTLVQSLLNNGAYAPEIARMLSLITDAATQRLVRLAIAALGDPPVPFAFLALGSEGRMEQTLFTDQDNAILYADIEGADHHAVSGYFVALADFVCTGLISSGYRTCKGKVMANNPQWCQSGKVWREYFDAWIIRADLRELMEFSIFFDFRVVYGEETLAGELQRHVMRAVQGSPRFFSMVAQNALQVKSPMRLFGIVVAPTVKGDRTHHIDLKLVTMPIVSFARLYSLQQGITETNTFARIEELVRKGVLLPSKQEDIKTAFALLLRLRLQHQAAIMQLGGQPDNHVDPSTLGHIEEAILRESFNEIDLLQDRIKRDFLGG